MSQTNSVTLVKVLLVHAPVLNTLPNSDPQSSAAPTLLTLLTMLLSMEYNEGL